MLNKTHLLDIVRQVEVHRADLVDRRTESGQTVLYGHGEGGGISGGIAVLAECEVDRLADPPEAHFDYYPEARPNA
jgi:hypothetical protein